MGRHYIPHSIFIVLGHNSAISGKTSRIAMYTAIDTMNEAAHRNSIHRNIPHHTDDDKYIHNCRRGNQRRFHHNDYLHTKPYKVKPRLKIMGTKTSIVKAIIARVYLP
jgi:hypothetical protein